MEPRPEPADQPVTYPSFEEERIKHLELIQTVIGRLGNDAFVVKGWAVTVAGVFLGLAVNSNDADLAFVSVIPTLAFWGLDTYFLRSERLFRELYEHVRSKSTAVAPFFMGATSPDFRHVLESAGRKDVTSWRQTAIRPTILIFYLALLAAALGVAWLICTS